MRGKETDADLSQAQAAGGMPTVAPAVLSSVSAASVSASGSTVASEALADTTAAGEPREPDDVALVQAIAAGDRAALAALYDRFAPRLLGLAGRLMNNPLDAEDLLHDLFLEVWNQAHRYDATRGSVVSWLVLRLRSRGIDRLRSPSYRRVVSLESEPAGRIEEAAPWADELFVGDQLAGALQRAVAELPHDTQSILNLVYFKGMSLPEVASKMTLPLGTVKSRLHRALRSLRLAVAGPEAAES